MRQCYSESNVLDLYQQAQSCHQAGDITQEKIIYRQLLELQPENPDVLCLLGIAECQTGNIEAGLCSIEKSLEIFPNQPEAHYIRGNAQQMFGNLEAAVESYDRAVALKSDYVEAHSNRGVALQGLRRFEEAVGSYERAIAINPGYPFIHSNRGVALQELGQFNAALESYNKALAIKPDYAEAYSNRGNVLRELGAFDAAIESFDRAIAIEPTCAEAHYNRGLSLANSDRLEEALSSYERAIAIMPDYAEVYSNRGNVLRQLGKLGAALESYNRALAIKPDYAEAYSNRGVALQETMRFEEALGSYDRAIEIRPDYAEAYYNRGQTLQALKKPDEALASFNRAMALKPDIHFLYGDLLHTKMRLCLWDDMNVFRNDIMEKVMNHENVSHAFIMHTLSDSPAVLKKCAQSYSETACPHQAMVNLKYRRHDKIRVGYFSSDFGDHPVTHHLAGMFEEHDRSKCDVIGFSFIHRTGQWTDRVARAFDQFVEVQNMSDKEVAMLARSMEIDIAVDLNGYTQGGRPCIFAQRAAPIQISYIGFLGTMGASFMDYLIADKTIIPEENKKYYTEKIIYLPSYQCNDKFSFSNKEFSRHEMGLPEDGFVFCSFNDNYKIMPDVFDSWIRILKRVPEGVLWLFASNETAVRNFRKESEKRGLDSDRLVFAKRMTLEDHLARQRLADLFLDTFPYNAGATASNALRVGLPVLTRAGRSFASRIASSLLQSLGLPELITTTPEEYESLAIQLASNQQRYRALKQKLVENLKASLLFNAQQFARSLEAAFIAVYDEHQKGLDAEAQP